MASQQNIPTLKSVEPIILTQMPWHQSQVDLGGLQIGVAEELLDVPDVGATASPLTHYWEPNHRRASTAQPLIPKPGAIGGAFNNSWNCRKKEKNQRAVFRSLDTMSKARQSVKGKASVA